MKKGNKKRKIFIIWMTVIGIYLIANVVSFILPFYAKPAKNTPIEPFMHVSWYVSPDDVIKTTGQPGSSFDHGFKTIFWAYPEKNIFERTARVSYYFEYNHLYECSWIFTDPLSEQAAIIQDVEAALTEYGLNPVQVTNPTKNFSYYGDADTLVYVVKGPIINMDEIISVKVVLIYRHSKIGAIHESALK